jgi:hypothetical protein
MKHLKCRYSEDYEKCHENRTDFICNSSLYKVCGHYVDLVRKDRKEIAERHASEKLEKELKECQEFDRLSRERYLEDELGNGWP